MPWELNIPASDLAQLNDRARVRSVTKKELSMDEAAFRIFYAETARPLLSYLLRVFGERSGAEDLMQEAYCRLLSADLPSMNSAEQKRYLFRIATNLMRDRWRHHGEQPLTANLPEMVDSAPPLERELAMRQAFARLKPRERQLLWLAYVEGSSHKEIADCTGLRAGSIRLLLFRARRKLAELIGGKQQHDDREEKTEVLK